MPILQIELTRHAANFLHPAAMQDASKALHETLCATVTLAGVLAKQGRLAKASLDRESQLDFGTKYRGTSLTVRTVIEEQLANGMTGALPLIEASTSAEALENIPGTVTVRRYLAKINRALAERDYACNFSFSGQKFTLAGLGLAAHANLDMPWEGHVALIPDQWHVGSKHVQGTNANKERITLDLAHDPKTFSDLMTKAPRALRFHGSGYRNNKILRVIAKSTPAAIDPAEALGELKLAR